MVGEPAEKVCGSKPVHAAKGYYDGADAFIFYHPHFTNTAIRDTQCGSYWSVVFAFETTEPEKWIDKRLLVGGDATSDNLPPRFSQIQYAWRSPSLGIQQQIYTVLEQNARHVAAMTGSRASVRWVTISASGSPITP